MKSILLRILVFSLLLIPWAGMAQTVVEIWVQRYRSPQSNASAMAIAVDTSGNVFVTGTGELNYATIKYSKTGVPLWTKIKIGPGNNARLREVTIFI